jgi:hypothetical protein
VWRFGVAPLVNCSDVPITLGAWIEANERRNATPGLEEICFAAYFECLIKTFFILSMI